MPRFLTPLLERLERFLRIDVRYALSGGFFLSLTQVSSAVIGLGLTIAFANLLPVETYGTYRYVLAVYGILALFALPGIDTAVLQSISQGKDASFLSGIRAKLKWGLLGSAAALIYAGYHFHEGSNVLGAIFIIVAAVLPFMEAFALYSGFLNGKRLFRHWAVADITVQIISAVTLITTMFFTKNIVVLMGAYFLPYAITRFIISFSILQCLHQNQVNDPGLFAYGRSLTVFQIISRLITSADQIVLYHFLGPVQVAIFSLATAIPNRVQSLFRITGSLAFPKFASRSAKEVALTLPRKMLLFVLGILAICILYIFAAPLLFEYLFPKYLPSLAYSQVVIFYTLSAITYPFGSYLFAHKKVRDNYTLAIGSFVPKMLCLAFLVPILGIWGAIIGILVTSFATLCIASWMLYRDARGAD